jgi:hypothetical protein
VPSNRRAGLYGEDIPIRADLLGEWFAGRISAWGTSVGMEIFPHEEDKEGKRTIALGGKILVLDVELNVWPHAEVIDVRTTFAVPNEGSQTTEGSTSLGAFLVHVMQSFLLEAKKGEDADAVTAAKLGQHVQDGLKYLMQLERLALKEGENGIRWFRDIDAVGLMVEGVARMEADSIRLYVAHSPQSPVLKRLHQSQKPPLRPFRCFPAAWTWPVISLSPQAFSIVSCSCLAACIPQSEKKLSSFSRGQRCPDARYTAPVSPVHPLIAISDPRCLCNDPRFGI